MKGEGAEAGVFPGVFQSGDSEVISGAEVGAELGVHPGAGAKAKAKFGARAGVVAKATEEREKRESEERIHMNIFKL